MSDTDDLLTVAEAARRLGVQERQARRWAAKLPDSDRTLDRTGSGRTRQLVRLSALRQMKEAAAGAASTSGHGPDSDRTPDRTEATSLATVAAAYERVIQEQAARITALEADKGRMEADKARLYDLLEQAQANLQREQTLRLLSAPQGPAQAETPETPDSAQGEADASAAAKGGVQGGAAGKAPERAGFWAWLFPKRI